MASTIQHLSPNNGLSCPTASHDAASVETPRERTTSFRGYLADACWIVGACLTISVACRLVLAHVMNVPLDNQYLWRDLVGNLVVVLLLWALVRSRWQTIALSVVIVGGGQICNGIKLLVLGVPASPDDFINIFNLVHLQTGISRVITAALIAFPLLLLLIFIKWRKRMTWVVLASLATLTVATISYSSPIQAALDTAFKHSVWNQPENFRRRGLTLHLVQEAVRTAAKVGRTPSASDVAAALDSMPSVASADLSGIDRRNVHMIVLESFFDPLSLGEQWVPDDPFDPAFRALWAETEHSVALSPVFGGYTANAEFEALCGYPVIENAVFFEGWLRRPVPCIPRAMADAGFHTVASHPNVAGFWNRTHAYRLIGFDEYLSKEDFDMSDNVGGLLMDHSYLPQVFDRLPDDGRPVFNYMLTYYGHLPYPGSERYPEKVKAGQDAPLLTAYLNQLWYKTRGIMAQLDELRRRDPDALIVIFGDHLPFLAPDYGVYREAVGLPKMRQDFDGNMLEYLATTPLIVIDGDRGPIPVGKLPLYRLPALILDTLGVEEHGMFSWTDSGSDRLYRPLHGLHVEASADKGTAIACPPESENAACAQGLRWMERTRTLIADVFTGDQHALDALSSAR